MGELTATGIYLVRRQLVQALIALERLENGLQEERGGKSLENRELLEQVYAEAQREAEKIKQ